MTAEPPPDGPLLRALAELQATNEVLVRDLHRARQSELEARVRLEDHQRSWSYRLVARVPAGVRRGTVGVARKLLAGWRRYGWRHMLLRLWCKLRRQLARLDCLPKECPAPLQGDDEELVRLYERWIALREPDEAALARQRRERLAHEPTISVVVPVHETPVAFLVAMVESVRAQTYPHWQLCVADGGVRDAAVAAVLDGYRHRDARVVVRSLGENRGIAGNTNAALELATGEYVAFLDHDDTLAPFALYEVARAINRFPDADLIYSDEDKIDESGVRRYEPFFKPAWSPDTLRSYNYVCHLSVYRRGLLGELGGVREGFDGAQDYDLALRASERCRRVVHVPHVLYHWREHASSTARGAGVKPGAAGAIRRAVADHLRRTGLGGEVLARSGRMTHEVRLALPRRPLVSLLIPNKDARATLGVCLRSLERSSYPHVEVLVVENNSTDPATFDYYRELERRPGTRVVSWGGPFNYAAINNWAARQARGEVLVLLNNDTEVLTPDWLERMLEHALRAEVGAVGAKLFFPDGTIQHAGITVGMGGVASHPHRLLPDRSDSRQRLEVVRNVTAVTAACLMVRREVYEAVGGMDERFVVAFNDVDLCLRIHRLGKRLVWTPYAELRHYESKTRGADDTPAKQLRFAREVQLFQREWADFLAAGDPYYNPNLTLAGTDCTPDLEYDRLGRPPAVARAA